MDMQRLPGGCLIAKGLDDLHSGRESAEALLVAIGAPRLRRLGFKVPAFSSPEHRLYLLLARTDPDGAHSRFNALIRRLTSFERAAEALLLPSPLPEFAASATVSGYAFGVGSLMLQKSVWARSCQSLRPKGSSIDITGLGDCRIPGTTFHDEAFIRGTWLSLQGLLHRYLLSSGHRTGGVVGRYCDLLCGLHRQLDRHHIRFRVAGSPNRQSKFNLQVIDAVDGLDTQKPAGTGDTRGIELRSHATKLSQQQLLVGGPGCTDFLWSMGLEYLVVGLLRFSGGCNDPGQTLEGQIRQLFPALLRPVNCLVVLGLGDDQGVLAAVHCAAVVDWVMRSAG